MSWGLFSKNFLSGFWKELIGVVRILFGFCLAFCFFFFCFVFEFLKTIPKMVYCFLAFITFILRQNHSWAIEKIPLFHIRCQTVSIIYHYHALESVWTTSNVSLYKHCYFNARVEIFHVYYHVSATRMTPDQPSASVKSSFPVTYPSVSIGF